MRKVCLVVCIIALLGAVALSFCACNFLKEGTIVEKYYTELDYRITVQSADGKEFCVYVTEDYSAYDKVSVGDEFSYSVFGTWRPSATTLYVGE